MISFDSVLEVLGKTKTDTEFSDLISSVGQPSKLYDAAGITILEFYEFGFGLSYGLKRECFWLAGFEYSSKHVQSGVMRPFGGPLYKGIDSNDGIEQINEKLALNPIKTRRSNSSFIAKYNAGVYQVSCIFSNVTERLESATIELV